MKDWEVQKLVFCHPIFLSDFQRSANTSGDVLRILLRKGVITETEKKELFGLSPQKRNYRISKIIMNKRIFNLQPLIEAMRAVPENEALLNLLQNKIEKKKAQLQNAKPNKEKINNGMNNITHRIATELLPLAVGEEKAAVIQSEQRNHGNSTIIIADENLTTVLKHLERKKDCLHDLCTRRHESFKIRIKKSYESKIKKMKKDHEAKVAEYERKLAEQYEHMQEIQRRNEDLETNIKHRISQGIERLRNSLQGSGVQLNGTNKVEEEEEEVGMKHANSYTNIANMTLIFNENNTTGPVVINQGDT